MPLECIDACNLCRSWINSTAELPKNRVQNLGELGDGRLNLDNAAVNGWSNHSVQQCPAGPVVVLGTSHWMYWCCANLKSTSETANCHQVASGWTVDAKSHCRNRRCQFSVSGMHETGYPTSINAKSSSKTPVPHNMLSRGGECDHCLEPGPQRRCLPPHSRHLPGHIASPSETHADPDYIALTLISTCL